MNSENKLKAITLNESLIQSSPHPFALLVSKDIDKKNVMGVSWYSFASLKPGKMIFILSEKSYTSKLLKMGSYVSLCVPKESVKDIALSCSHTSGRDIDKVAKFGIDLVAGEDEKAWMIKESNVAWVLKINDKIHIDDHNLFVAVIISCHGDGTNEGLRAFEGYKRLDTI
jgi:flavin reductase (DIM6/NTAB) family NADH-FMN oxidoreductase RutF